MVYSDLHCPYQEPKAVDLVLKFARDFKPNYQVIIGDLLNLDGISRWNEKRFISQYQNQIFDDFYAGNKLLDQIQATNPKSEFHYLEGNHEYRAYEFCERHPSFLKMVDIQRNLCIKDRGIKYYEYIDQRYNPLQIGKLRFMHGNYTNKYHSSKMVDEIGHPVVYGHTHSIQVFTKRELGVIGGRRIAYCIGCLFREDFARYLKQSGSSWALGFGYFYMTEDGNFNFYVVPITNNQFICEGQLYK